MKNLFIILSLTPALTFASQGLLEGIQVTPPAAATLGVLGVDTSGNYVADISAGNGISTTGAPTGETISHTISVNQDFDFTMTGNFTFAPAGTDDLTIQTDADSLLTISGLTDRNGSVLCKDTNQVLGSCADAAISGNLTAANFSGSSSGTNTGDQTITLTGDVTGTGTGSFATTISANAVALGTDTTGSYVADLTAGTNISVSGGGSETANITVNVVANPTFATSVTSPKLVLTSGTLPTCNNAAVGTQVMYTKGAGASETKSLCVCEQLAGPAYAWSAATSTGDCT